MSKGSVSLFIILGILILVILVASFSFIPSIPVVETQNVGNVRTYLSSCIKESGEFALFVLGRQGGHIIPTSPSHWEPYGIVGFAFYQEKNLLPSQVQMEQELSAFLQTSLAQCADSFTVFQEQGVDIKEEDVRVQTTFLDKEVRVVVDYPLKIQQDGQTVAMNVFSYNFPVRIAYIQQSLDALLERKLENPAFWDITYLESLELNSTLLVEDNGDELLIVTDSISSLNHEPYRFIIAADGGEVV